MSEAPRRGSRSASLNRLGAVAGEELDGKVSDAAHAEGRARLAAALASNDAESPPRRVSPKLRVGLLAAAVVGLLALALLFVYPRGRLEFTIDDGAVAGSYVRAVDKPAILRFSEGTVIEFAEGSRGRVVEVSAKGARVDVESGTARFSVVHREGASWRAEAGPYSVEVTGTEFDLGWNEDQLAVDLHHGGVVVRGPLAPNGIALTAGQRLEADDTRGDLRITGGEVAAAVTSSKTATTIDSPPVDISAPIPVTASGPSWSDRVKSGDFKAVLAEADARGVSGVIANASLPDLAALADAARYEARNDLAERALSAERTRFPGSAQARSAAFLLGRLVETKSPSAAVDWYDRYLGEAPHGPLAEEALGRKMLALRKTGGRAAAASAAEHYAKAYPRGAFAKAAQDILAAP